MTTRERCGGKPGEPKERHVYRYDNSESIDYGPWHSHEFGRPGRKHAIVHQPCPGCHDCAPDKWCGCDRELCKEEGRYHKSWGHHCWKDKDGPHHLEDGSVCVPAAPEAEKSQEPFCPECGGKRTMGLGDQKSDLAEMLAEIVWDIRVGNIGIARIKSQGVEEIAEHLRPHLTPQAPVPEEVEKVAAWARSRHDDVEGWAVTVHKADLLQISQLLRSQARQIAALQARVGELEDIANTFCAHLDSVAQRREFFPSASAIFFHQLRERIHTLLPPHPPERG